MRTLCRGIIRAYRYAIAPLIGPSCRFEPSCSQYALDAIERYGVLRGGSMVLVRLLKCHPFHPGGEDPVR
ncbi:MAG: membrane protein insertion efficiency factor YidD [Nitrospira sp.]|nr:membrane protein insertion efficiency factor YidD [Nitrospira sp.]